MAITQVTMLVEWSKSSKISSLTTEVLQEIVRKAEANDKIHVVKWELRETEAKGDHYASKMYKLRLHVEFGNKESKTEIRDVIIKVPPEIAVLGDTIIKSSAFPTEIAMYRDTLPEMYELLNEVAPGKYQKFGPKFYYGKDSHPYILFLEDLSPKRYVMAERRKGLDLDHSLLVMKTLGIFHAASACIADKYADKYSKNAFCEDSSADFMDHFVSTVLRDIAVVVEKWPQDGAIYAEKLRNRSSNLTQEVREIMKPETNSFNVIIHGDLWVNNMLFKYDEVNRCLENMVFIDYQMCCYGSPAIDLQYFINTSPSDHIRVEYSEQLLREYHASLCETLETLGYEKKIITFNELLEEYEKKSVYGFFAAMTILPVVLADPEDYYNFESEANKTEGISKSQLNRLTSKEFSKVLRRLLPIYEKKNVI